MDIFNLSLDEYLRWRWDNMNESSKKILKLFLPEEQTRTFIFWGNQWLEERQRRSNQQ